MKEFICKIENMSKENIHLLIAAMSTDEVEKMLEELLHHHLNETKRQWEMIKDINEDKKVFRDLYNEEKEEKEELENEIETLEEELNEIKIKYKL